MKASYKPIIPFENVQAGDTVRCTYNAGDLTVITEGIVFHITRHSGTVTFRTPENRIIANTATMQRNKIVVELLHRPVVEQLDALFDLE